MAGCLANLIKISMDDVESLVQLRWFVPYMNL